PLLLLLLPLWGLWSTPLRCPQTHRGLGRRADLSGARDDIIGLSLLIDTNKAARAIENGEAAVGILMYPYRSSDVMLPVALRWNLKATTVPGDAIISADHPILLNAEDVLDGTPNIGHERRAWLGRRHCETRVVIRNETFFEVAIGRRDGPDFCEPQFLREALLQRAEHALHSSAPLRRIGRDVADAELRKSTTNLGQL